MKLHQLIKWYLSSLYIRFKGRPAKLRKAIRAARKLYKVTGKRYRVFFLSGQYQVMSRDDLQRSKHARSMGWHVNSTSMNQFAFYDTATDDTLKYNYVYH